MLVLVIDLWYATLINYMMPDCVCERWACVRLCNGLYHLQGIKY